MAYALPPGAGMGSVGGPAGHTYAAVLVRLDGVPSGRRCTRDDVLGVLRELRFSGWVGPREEAWLVVVAARGGGTVAAGRRGVVGVAEELAGRLGAPVVAVRVLDDRQLLLAVWDGAQEVGRYVSDPSHGLGDDEVLPDSLGVEHAAVFAAVVGRPEAGEELAELLGEELDPESVYESERLAGVLRVLGLPRWLVAATSLPRDVPIGPRAREMTRLGAGREGLGGRVRGRAAEVVRGRRPPPSAVPDPPRGAAGFDPWL